MTGLIFTAALLLALSFVVAKRVARRREKRQRDQSVASKPGYSAEHPLKIARYDEIDDAIATWRCPCGGLLDRIGEGSRPGVRVVRCACVTCEEDVDLFFDLSELLH